MGNLLLQVAIGNAFFSHSVIELVRFVLGPNKVDRVIAIDTMTVSSGHDRFYSHTVR